jgi:hypothetical protein
MAMLKDQRGQTIHTVTQRFGFRTVEVRQGDGIYVNNTRIIFKGANRHSFWPASGRTLSREVHLMDINLMKEMNMNAVRMSHYPPDQDFLDLCDSLGLFVLDELTGWQAKYDSVVGRKLVKELIRRDVNHPSIVLWANGNEGGWNTALDDDFKSEDIQQRFVYHPWGKFRGTDTKHYPDYNYVVNSALYGTDIFFPTEFMHGLYDGGHGAGLSDFWEKMLAHPFGAGGFLWALVDEGIVRPDKGNTIDTHSNSAPDGIVGPFREKEGSFYAIKEIWSPVKIRKSGEGFIIENHFLFTDLSECTYRWELDALSYQGSSQVFISKGTGTGTINKIAAGQSGDLELNLPADWPANDRLSVIIQGPGQREVYRKTWSLRSPAETAAVLTKPAPSLSQAEIVDEGNQWTIRCDGLQYRFSKSSGYLSAVVTQKNLFSLNGPRHAGFQHELKSLMHHREGAAIVFEANYSSGDNWFKSTWTFDAGRPVRLDYQYSQRGECDFMGLTFQYPEEKIQSIRWLGQGPYRVWKNRMEGTQFGIWEKTFNNTVTGEQWQYPEFKGYHAGVHWVELKNTEGTFTVICENRNVFLHMLTPGKPQGAYNDYTSPPFPDGNISFLQAISPIGTKFQPAQVMGPSSQKNMMLNYTPVSGTLWFDFTN